MRRLRLVGLAPLLLLLGCGHHFDGRTDAVLAGATKVEVFRIDSDMRPEAWKHYPEDAKRIGGYPVTAQEADQGKRFADKLAGVLSDGRTYSTMYAGCFNPGVAFRVWKGDESVDVVICFQCENFYCGPPQAEEMENASFHGTPARARLVRLAKEAFPDDQDIQALGE